MQIVRIRGVFKDYSWGSRDVLPAMFHYDADGRPQAEAWFGVHPEGQARLEDGTLLKDYLESDPEALFGEGSSAYVECFPLMLKVLAVNNPLSLHVHPDAEQAAIGWRNEELDRRAGRDASLLDYSDSNCKNELYYALTPSTLMCGFRDFDSIHHHLTRLLPCSFDRLFSRSGTIRGLVKTLFSLGGDELKTVIDEFLSSLQDAGEESRRGGVYYTERGISERIFSLFGHDASVVMPYLMNVVHMRIGDAVYIHSGMLHTYVHGTGVELEDSSDNEVRLGMSGKHKDIPAGLNLIDFDAGFSGKLDIRQDRFLRQRADGGTLSLAILPSGSYDIRERVPSIALCTEGQARVGTSVDHVMLKEGECCFIPSCDEEYHIRVAGKVFQAVFPEKH